MEEEADDTLTSTGISSANRKKYDEVVKKLDDFYKVRTNIILLERAQFNRRSQRPGETIEQCITVLYQLIATCEYGTFKRRDVRSSSAAGGGRQKGTSSQPQASQER